MFLQHGPPLVLKCDNGSPFIAEQTQELLAAWGVTTLFSPPYTPRNSGACEAGIGGLKVRTHHLAAVHGRPGRWTTEDVEAARRLADEEQYPRRLHGRTAEESGKHVRRRRRKNDVAAATSSNSVDKRSVTNEASPYSKSWTGPAKLRSTVGPSAERSSRSAIFRS